MHKLVRFCHTNVTGCVTKKIFDSSSSSSLCYYQGKAANSIVCSSSSLAFCRQAPQLSRLSCLIAPTSRLSFFVLLQDIFSLIRSHLICRRQRGRCRELNRQKWIPARLERRPESTISSFKASLGGAAQRAFPPSSRLPLHRLIPLSASPTRRRRHGGGITISERLEEIKSLHLWNSLWSFPGERRLGHKHSHTTQTPLARASSPPHRLQCRTFRHQHHNRDCRDDCESLVLVLYTLLR